MSATTARRPQGWRAGLILLLLLGARPAAAGVQEVKFDAELYGRTRQVWIWTPPAIPADSAGLLIVFDGAQYQDDIPLPRMLDSLTAAGSIRPVVAVLIDNGTGVVRRQDLANRAEFADWLSDQLVPWVRKHYAVSHDSRRTIVCGSSAGGLAAAYVAFKRPDLFGNVLSQSGAFWRGNENSDGAPYEWLTAQYPLAPRAHTRFWLDVGALETKGTLGGTAPSILAANRRLRDALRKEGYEVLYTEIPGGVHSPASWAAHLPAALVALAGQSPGSAKR